MLLHAVRPCNFTTVKSGLFDRTGVHIKVRKRIATMEPVNILVLIITSSLTDVLLY